MEPALCEVTSDGQVVVSKQSLGDLTFGPDGLATIVINQRDLYFVTRQGKTAPALNFDNGPDYFVDGLARTVKNGKIGFVNGNLDLVVPPVWDFAFPFEHGVAVVCTGCAFTPAARGDEHRRVTGGKWGYIDRRGRVVVPVEYDSRSLPSVAVAERQAAR